MKTSVLYVPLLIFIIMLTGCIDSQYSCNNHCLIRVGDRIATIADFNQDIEIARAAYSYNMTSDPAFLRNLYIRVMHEMAEEMIILETAKRLNVQVSKNELQEAVVKIKKDYSKQAFEEELIEQAISYNTWESKLKDRLIIEKMIKKALQGQISLTEDEVADYYLKHFSQNTGSVPKNINEVIIKHLHIYKKEEAYKTWMADIKKNIQITVNKDLWEKIISNARLTKDNLPENKENKDSQ